MKLGDDVLETLAQRQVSLFELQNQYYKAVLRHVSGNRTKAAKLLGVAVSTIKQKIRRFEWESCGHASCEKGCGDAPL